MYSMSGPTAQDRLVGRVQGVVVQAMRLTSRSSLSSGWPLATMGNVTVAEMSCRSW